MENKRIAARLLRIARSVVAGEYPKYTSDRVQEAIDTIYSGLANKQIWNMDYKEETRKISRGFEDAEKEIKATFREDDSKFFSRFMYFTFDISGLRSVPKAIRQCEEFIRNPNYEMPEMRGFFKDQLSPERLEEIEQERREEKKNFERNLGLVVDFLKDYVDFLRSWLPVIGAIKEAKKYIEKGRKPNPDAKKKDVYVAPAVPTQSLTLVRKTLESVVKKQYKDVVDDITEWTIGRAEYFLRERKPEDTPWKFFMKAPGVGSDVAKLVELVGGNERMPKDEKEYKLSSSARTEAAKLAKQTADHLRELFVQKNMDKIGSIVHKKGGLISAKVQNGRIDTFGFSGQIKFRFSDKTEFIVRNKAVLKSTRTGTLFEQYPTTFHNVVSPDGTVNKMVSQKDMNDKWAKM